MKDTILAISGRPGLFRLLAQGRGNLIVETLDAKRLRFAVGQRDRVTSLGDVSMFSDEEDVPLTQVLQNIADKHANAPLPFTHKSATEAQLLEVMEEGLPNYDRDRVHLKDMRKLVQWYNILAQEGVTDFVEKDKETDK